MTSTWLRWEEARLSGTAFQGIEYVKLEQAGEGLHRLRLKLWRPAQGLTARSFAVGSGRRTLSWSVESLSTSSDQAVLLLSGSYDDQPYRVRLLEGGSLTLNPFFAEAEFLFGIDEDRGDCRPAPEPEEGPLRAARPAVDLLTKDYNGFVSLLADRIRVLNPHWADLSPSSLERVLVELLAHHADMLSYYQDRVAAEAFVELATQRHSLRQHGLLLDYTLFEGSAAETLMAFEVERDGTLPASLSFRTQGESAEARVIFHLPESARVVASHGRLRVAAWPGALQAELPEGATEVLLWGRVNALQPGQRLAFTQGGTVHVAQVVSSQALRLQGWQAAPEPVASPAWQEVTAVAFHPPLPVAFKPFTGGFALYGNLAVARHGELRVAWYRPAPGRAVSRNHYLLPEDRQNAVHSVGEGGRRLLRAIRLPGPVLFTAQRGQPVPLLEVRVGGRPWTRVEHLHRSQSFHPHYVASADEDGAVWLQFGDGIQGLAVEDASADVEARYYVGDPIAGNCAPNRLTALVPPEEGAARAQLEALGEIKLHNVTAGVGGRQPETKEAARLGIAASVRHGSRERAVSLEDCAELARSVPGVARVGIRLLGGPFNTVQVLVDPEGRIGLTAELQAAVQARLEEARLAGRELRVEGPRYVPLELVLVVTPLTGFPPHQVREGVLTALRPGTAASPGYFHPDRLGFGEAVEMGRIIAHVHRVPGVRAVAIISLRRLSERPGGPVPQRLVLEPEEIALLDGDPSTPENGTLRVLVEGLDDLRGIAP